VKTRHVPPVYPATAQTARIQGLVVLEALIGPDGKVSDAKIVQSIPLLDQAAVDAVKQWEFTPTMVDGAAVPVLMTVSVNFALK
jgi:protein TonB